MPELILRLNSPKSDIAKLILSYTNVTNVKLTLNSAQTDTLFKLDDGTSPYVQFPVILEYILRRSQTGSLLLPSNVTLKASMDSFVNLASKHDYAISEVGVLRMLNDHLLNETFFVGVSVTLADLVLFVSLYKWIVPSKPTDLMNFVNLARWYDHIQHLPGVLTALSDYKKLTLFENKSLLTQVATKDKEKKPKQEKGKDEKKPTQGTVARPFDDVTRLNVIVGLVVSIRKHPDADKLYCLRIDVGKEVRNICSGLVEFLEPNQILDKKVCVLANLSKKTLRGEESNGMVLCVSDPDRKKVELLEPPPEAKVGERIYWEGYTGEPDDVLSTKKGKETFALVQKVSCHIERVKMEHDSD